MPSTSASTACRAGCAPQAGPRATLQQRTSVANSAPLRQRVSSAALAAAPAASAARPQRRLALDVAANTQRSNSVTKKRTSGPPGLPPINDNSGGGGGGGWDGHRIARNLAINAGLFAIYCLLDSGGPGNIFGGGGGGGGGGHNPHNLPQPDMPQLTMRELDCEEEEDARRARKKKGGKKRSSPRLATA